MKKSYRPLLGGLLLIPLLLLTLTGCGGGDSTSALAALSIFRASASGSIEADNSSQAPAISADGLFTAFSSDASNLLGAGGDTNGFRDIFVTAN